MSSIVASSPAKTGRPSKLDPDVKRRLFVALQTGVNLADACDAAGAAYNTIHEWVQRGEGRHPTRKATPEYTQFAQEYRKAIASAQVRLASKISTAAEDDWRAAAWLLERRHPETWANTQRVRVEVEKELEKTIQHLEARLTPDAFNQVLDALIDAGDSETEEGGT